jgi:EmrB/QacA subfamily drug resistance transporter
VLLVVSSGVFLSSLDQFIVNIAFPAIGQDFAPVSRASLSWVLTGYTIGFAALLAPAGRLADRFGRRRLFLSGMVVFTTASAAAGASWNVASLVSFRVVQSFGAAMVMSTSLALLLHTFPPARRAFAISVWSAVGAVAATCGPTIGGLLVQSSWRWIFLVNLPVGVAAMLVGRRVLTESRDAEETRWPDFLGTALIVTGVAAVTFGLVVGADRGYRDTIVVAALAGGAVALVATVLRAAWTPARLVPVLPLPLFRVRTFATANLAMTTFMIAFGALMLGNVLFFTEVWHLPSVRIGLYLLPAPAIAALVAVPGGWLGNRLGHGPVAAFGVALYGFACLWFASVLGPAPEYVRDYLPGQVIAGIGGGTHVHQLRVRRLVHPAAGVAGQRIGHAQRGPADRHGARRRAAVRRDGHRRRRSARAVPPGLAVHGHRGRRDQPHRRLHRPGAKLHCGARGRARRRADRRAGRRGAGVMVRTFHAHRRG